MKYIVFTASMTLTILADDLTGACDTGALFAGPGPVPVTVWPSAAPDGSVRVIDTETRSLDADTARERVSRAVASAGPGRYFKKIDSTLRGHVAVEIDAVMRAIGVRSALVCPALPREGRIVLDATLLVHGRPVSETTLADDPQFPRPRGGRTASVVEILRSELDRPLGWISLGGVRAGRATLAARLSRLDGVVSVADAESDNDLEALVNAAFVVEPPPLLVGAAGLARALARRLGLAADGVVPPPSARWLIVGGSLHPVCRRQLAHARLEGLSVLASPDEPSGEPRRVADRLAREAARLLGEGTFDAVAVSGGDTAVALFRALGAERLDLVGAPSTGLALGRLSAPRRPPLWLLTKAGGFGAPDFFVSLARRAA
jgi:D-threonate/D-erythronate kinase